MQKMHELHLPTDYYLVYTPADLAEGVTFPSQIWEAIGRLSFSDKAQQSQSNAFLIGYFQKKTWVIEEDLYAERALRRRIKSNIEDKYTHVNAGIALLIKGKG